MLLALEEWASNFPKTAPHAHPGEPVWSQAEMAELEY